MYIPVRLSTYVFISLCVCLFSSLSICLPIFSGTINDAEGFVRNTEHLLLFGWFVVFGLFFVVAFCILSHCVAYQQNNNKKTKTVKVRGLFKTPSWVFPRSQISSLPSPVSCHFPSINLKQNFLFICVLLHQGQYCVLVMCVLCDVVFSDVCVIVCPAGVKTIVLLVWILLVFCVDCRQPEATLVVSGRHTAGQLLPYTGCSHIRPWHLRKQIVL